jgi:hypothetical protein
MLKGDRQRRVTHKNDRIGCVLPCVLPARAAELAFETAEEILVGFRMVSSPGMFVE